MSVSVMKDYKLKLGKLRASHIQRFQIGVFRPIRVDHTDFFKWILKLIHSGLAVEMEHRKIETRLTIDKFCELRVRWVSI